MNTMAKIFFSLIKNIIIGCLDLQHPREEAEFRRGYSTRDNIHTIRQLIEKFN